MNNQLRNSRARPGSGHVTLARAISKHGVASRSQARNLIEESKVSVNGITVRDADRWVDPRVDRIRINGVPLRKKEFIYLAMHKPSGVVTTRSDEKGRHTVYAFLPNGTPWVFPIGRLDKATSGLLLLTNDTRFGERVTGPEGDVPKTYEVRLETSLSDVGARTMEAGMSVGDVRYRAVRVGITASDRSVCRIVLTEGKNRQIRRMLAHLGYRVLSLHRVGIGTARLGGLPEGSVRRLSVPEVRSLLNGNAKEGPQ